MRKIIYISALLLAGIALKGQNVGINTDAPSQTLDIEGSLRIQDIPNGDQNTEILGWNLDNQATNHGKIVQAPNNSTKFFEIRTYTVNPPAGEDWINNIELGIKTEDYTAILLNYVLRDGKGEAVFFQTLATNDGTNTNPIYTDSGTNRGYLEEPTNDAESQTRRITGKYIASAAPIVLVYPKYDDNSKTTGEWVFYGDYPGSHPIGFTYDTNRNGFLRVLKTKRNASPIDPNEQYHWDLTVLVIKNDYIKDEYENK